MRLAFAAVLRMWKYAFTAIGVCVIWRLIAARTAREPPVLPLWPLCTFSIVLLKCSVACVPLETPQLKWRMVLLECWSWKCVWLLQTKWADALLARARARRARDFIWALIRIRIPVAARMPVALVWSEECD